MSRQLSWNKLKRHHIPEWMREAKFGIYTHWGIYSVPACGSNVSWYPCNMYREGTKQYEFHCEHFGHPSKFGYKDFIPMFTGEHFDPDEWAELFSKAGAKFAGPVAEHHDGFSMWNSKVNPWNSAKMGPKRDVVGELEKAVRKQNMKYMIALHHAENWKFFPHWIKEYDTADPQYAGLYGPPHNTDWDDSYIHGGVHNSNGKIDVWESQDKPNKEFLDLWLNKAKEVIDHCSPDMIWFDFGLGFVPESYKQKFLKYYLDTSESKGIDPLVTYKYHDMPVGCGMIDLELGRYDNLTYMEWLTDTTVDDGEAWGYMYNATYKTPKTLIHYLVDNVSKNGYLLLNVGPNSKGEIPSEAKEILLEIGRWLERNGEAIYGTTPWITYGQGPTKLEVSGSFNEGKTPQYTSEDIRFTVKDENLYAIVLGWPKNGAVVKDLPVSFRENEIESISMIGSDEPINWKVESNNLYLFCPESKPCEHAFVYKIVRKDMD